MVDPVKFYKTSIKSRGYFGAKHYYYNEMMQKYFAPMPMESTMAQIKAHKHLIPGKIYTYRYSPQNAGILDFYDNQPIIISLKNFVAKSTGNQIELGLNLNFIPSELRLFVIERLYIAYRGLIDQNAQRMDEGEWLDQTPLFINTYDFMKVLDYLWKSVGNTAYEFALRNYIFPSMNNIKAIDYDDWGKIIFIDSQDFSGASVADVYKAYWKYKIK